MYEKDCFQLFALQFTLTFPICSEQRINDQRCEYPLSILKELNKIKKENKVALFFSLFKSIYFVHTGL